MPSPSSIELIYKFIEHYIIPGLNFNSGINIFVAGVGSNFFNIHDYFNIFFKSNIKKINKNNDKKNNDLEEDFVSCLGAMKIIKDGWETEAIPKIGSKNNEKMGFFAKIFKNH